MLTDAPGMEQCDAQNGSVGVEAQLTWDPNCTPIEENASVLQPEKAFLETVLEEIINTEESLRKKGAELAALLKDDSTRLGTILENKRYQADLNAYLKGLNFSLSVFSRLLNE